MRPNRILARLLPIPDDDYATRRQKYVDGLKFRAVVSGAVVFLFVVLNPIIPDRRPPLLKLLPALTVLLLVNPFYWLLGERSAFSLRYFYLHWLIDLTLISMILFFLGGVDVPYALLAYLMLVVTSSTFLSMHASLIVATGASIMTIVLAFLQTTQLLDPHRIWAIETTVGVRIISIATAILFYYVFAYLAGSLADQLKSANLSLRAAQTKIEEQNRLLEDKVADRTRQLEGRNAEIEEFVHIVTHDLKNVSVGATETARLLLDSKDHLDRKSQRYAGYLLEDTRRMNEMLVQLLRLFRIDQRQAHRDSVDLRHMAANLIRGLGGRLDAKHITITLGALPVVRADDIQLRHVLGNLLDNAIKYCGNSASPQVNISCVEDLNEWVVEVRDNGIGIPANQQERIFQLYYRGSNQQVGGVLQEGEGVGLAICKRLVERWGGRIWVESELGVGTRISFSIPRFVKDEGG